MNARLDLVTPRDVGAIEDQFVAVYREAFSPPPYRETEDDVARYAERFPRHAAQDGFRCAVATDNDRLLGFAYGYFGRPGQWWHDTVRAALDPAVATRRLDGAFELVELAVVPPLQGQGIGGGLHDLVLAQTPAARAVTTTAQHENPAVRFYRRRGWLPLLEDFDFPGARMTYLVLGLELCPAASADVAPARS
ncbi:MAG: GNAT family N-acetyltransferase [Chloroflexota bacterium]|nr:GNAT family N-acetyltransferase [Chloroflexota bacterium]